MRCLLAMDLGDIPESQALRLILVTVEDLVAIHGCRGGELRGFMEGLEEWLAPKAIREIRLYGSRRRIEILIKDRGGFRESRVFAGRECSLSPVA